eukprot:TRINITY_DN75638_c0_g1_i1.p1 TRINITY_DN75638_c0_g1~~TRINITY_DN75638_c0_g1_i1.p1  ORF type:complete len:666 (-),score=92.70 TRINITY_DN75638_c0_g1_i1:76-2073(-)
MVGGTQSVLPSMPGAAEVSRSLFNRLDSDGSGFLEKQELKSARKIMMGGLNCDEVDIAGCWTDVDADRDGRVDWKEWQSFMSSCFEVLGRKRFISLASNWENRLLVKRPGKVSAKGAVRLPPCSAKNKRGLGRQVAEVSCITSSEFDEPFSDNEISERKTELSPGCDGKDTVNTSPSKLHVSPRSNGDYEKWPSITREQGDDVCSVTSEPITRASTADDHSNSGSQQNVTHVRTDQTPSLPKLPPSRGVRRPSIGQNQMAQPASQERRNQRSSSKQSCGSNGGVIRRAKTEMEHMRTPTPPVEEVKTGGRGRARRTSRVSVSKTPQDAAILAAQLTKKKETCRELPTSICDLWHAMTMHLGTGHGTARIDVQDFIEIYEAADHGGFGRELAWYEPGSSAEHLKSDELSDFCMEMLQVPVEDIDTLSKQWAIEKLAQVREVGESDQGKKWRNLGTCDKLVLKSFRKLLELLSQMMHIDEDLIRSSFVWTMSSRFEMPDSLYESLVEHCVRRSTESEDLEDKVFTSSDIASMCTAGGLTDPKEITGLPLAKVDLLYITTVRHMDALRATRAAKFAGASVKTIENKDKLGENVGKQGELNGMRKRRKSFTLGDTSAVTCTPSTLQGKLELTIFMEALFNVLPKRGDRRSPLQMCVNMVTRGMELAQES